MRKKYGYPELTHDAKRKILGLNSARLYDIKEVERGNLGKRYKPVDYENRMSRELKTILEFPGFTADKMTKFKDEYAAAGQSRAIPIMPGSG